MECSANTKLPYDDQDVPTSLLPSEPRADDEDELKALAEEVVDDD